MKKSVVSVLVFLLLFSMITVYGHGQISQRYDLPKPSFSVPIIPTGRVRISSPYGYRIHPITRTRTFHTGIDIAAPLGTPIRSVANGVVVSVLASNGKAGNEIRIRHGGGLVSRYLHMNQRTVKVGDVVRVGQVIGTVGSSGRSTGPHLHFEMYKDGRLVNPTGVAIGKF